MTAELAPFERRLSSAEKTAACRICRTNLEPFLSFGRMPRANAFLTPSEFETEYFFDLSIAVCPTCWMVQLENQPDPSKLFHEKYPFYTGSSRFMTNHFKDFANRMLRFRLQGRDPYVVEIGSNDGTFLSFFAEKNIRHTGIEPCANVAAVARKRGVRSVDRFFDSHLAQEIFTEEGKADLIYAANVMCHVPDLRSAVQSMKTLLCHDGLVVFEDPYWLDILDKKSYDQIYDEHAYYFTVHSVQFLFEPYGMEIVDVEPLSTHGGSLRYFIGLKGKHPVSRRVPDSLDHEMKCGMDRMKTYDGFRDGVESSKEKLRELLWSLKKKGKRIVGYAATSKSTTVNNYCGITPELVDFICDTTPDKQGKWSPGTHIPIRPYEEFSDPYPDYALLYGWNHKEEVFEKEQAFMKTGGKWIVYVPEVRLADGNGFVIENG